MNKKKPIDRVVCYVRFPEDVRDELDIMQEKYKVKAQKADAADTSSTPVNGRKKRIAPMEQIYDDIVTWYFEQGYESRQYFVHSNRMAQTTVSLGKEIYKTLSLQCEGDGYAISSGIYTAFILYFKHKKKMAINKKQ